MPDDVTPPRTRCTRVRGGVAFASSIDDSGARQVALGPSPTARTSRGRNRSRDWSEGLRTSCLRPSTSSPRSPRARRWIHGERSLILCSRVVRDVDYSVDGRTSRNCASQTRIGRSLERIGWRRIVSASCQQRHAQHSGTGEVEAHGRGPGTRKTKKRGEDIIHPVPVCAMAGRPIAELV